MTLQHDAVQPRTCVVCGWRTLTPDRGHVCTLCERQIRGHLMDLADLVLLLPAAVAPSNGVEGKLPIRVSVLDLTLPARTRPVRSTGAADATGESIAATLAWHAVRWSHTAPSLGWSPSNSVGSIGLWLYEQLHWACQVQSGIEEMAADVRAQLAAARWAISRNLTPRRYAAACRCGAHDTLIQEAGATWIRCEACGRLYEPEMLGELARASVPEDVLLYASQAALTLGVQPERVRQWAARGLLEPVPDEKGRPRYRRGDLDDVHRQTLLHAAGRCEIGLLVVAEDGEITPGELREYHAPAVVVIATGQGRNARRQRVRVYRGETRYFGPAPAASITVLGAAEEKQATAAGSDRRSTRR